MAEQQPTLGDSIQTFRSKGMPDETIVKAFEGYPNMQPRIQKFRDAGMPPDVILKAISPYTQDQLTVASQDTTPKTDAPPSFGQRMITAGKEQLNHAIEAGKGVIKGGLETVYDASKAAETAGTFGVVPYLERTLNPEFHKQRGEQDAWIENKLKANNSDQKLGKFAEGAAELLIPGPDALIAGKAATVGGRIARGVIKGALDEGARGLIKSKGDVKQAGEEAAVGAVAGGIFNGLLPIVGSALANKARRQYAKILHPAGLGASEIIEDTLLPKAGEGIKGVGSMLDKGKRSIGSLDKIYEQYNNQLTKDIAQMNATYDKLGKDVKLQMAPVIKDFIGKLKDKNVLVNGKLGNKDAETFYNTGISILKDMLKRVDTDTISKEAKLAVVRNFRQMVDDQLFDTKLLRSETTINDQVKTMLRDSIQKVIHAEHPTTEDVDAIVAFGSNAVKVLKAARRHTFGKTSTLDAVSAYRTARIGAGAAVGAAIGAGDAYHSKEDPTGYAIKGMIGTAAGAALGAAWASPLWRSTSAVAKNNVAKWIAEGKLDWAADAARRALGWSVLRTTPPPPNPKQAQQTTHPPTGN